MDMMARDGAALSYIVDDDDAVRKSLELLLEVIGFKVESFPSGTEFLTSDVAERGDCLILDVHMSELDGFDVIKLLKRDKRRSLPTIMISGHADLAMHGRAKEAGAVELLEKPIELTDLENTIRRAIGLVGATRAI